MIYLVLFLIFLIAVTREIYKIRKVYLSIKSNSEAALRRTDEEEEEEETT